MVMGPEHGDRVPTLELSELRRGRTYHLQGDEQVNSLFSVLRVGCMPTVLAAASGLGVPLDGGMPYVILQFLGWGLPNDDGLFEKDGPRFIISEHSGRALPLVVVGARLGAVGNMVLITNPTILEIKDTSGELLLE